MVLSVRSEKDAVSLIVQAKDAEAAQKLQTMADKGLNLMRQQIQGDASLREMLQALQQIGPRAVEDRVVLNVDLKLVGELVATTVARARASAGRSQCVNNLKLITLAMHNYHSKKKSFPPAYNQGPDGKPLLSWRVHILPYLDQQQALYAEFHLDEPWDSPHNKALIAKMPAVYACPSVPGLAESGKTTYLGPRGEKTMFPGARGVEIKEVTDGTSNTILVIEGNADQAVVWTRPDDWELGENPDMKTLFGTHIGGTNAAFADGSVHFLRDIVRPEVIRKLMTRNGGEVIGADEY